MTPSIKKNTGLCENKVQKKVSNRQRQSQLTCSRIHSILKKSGLEINGILPSGWETVWLSVRKFEGQINMQKRMMTIFLLVVLVLSGLLSLYSMGNLQGNARVINYTGVVRGATQRLC